MEYKLTSDYQPAGDQGSAIEALVKNIEAGEKANVLLGVTGSGKTFTVANVIKQIGRPVLILSHNKTLASQLYGEFKQFFPENAVEFFVSYYDYYQPEAYIASTNTYIEKDLMINQELDKLRLSTVSSLMSGRKDIIVVSSVSCIYGAGNPNEFKASIVKAQVGDVVSRNAFLFSLVEILYSRTEVDFTRGTFRVKGDTVDIYPGYADFAYRIQFWGEEIEQILMIEPSSGRKIKAETSVAIFPTNLFVTGKEAMHTAIK
ncbi:MAG: DEAD/DEAH box helicase family protein, partial [Leadbetterella sp.]